MVRVISGLGAGNDLRPVFLAALVCFVVSWLGCALVGKAVDGRSARPLWIAAAAIAVGSGVWATQFITVLGLRPDMPAHYDPVLVVAAWALAAVGAGIGFGLIAAARGWPDRLAGGVMFGLGGVLTQDVALAALRAPGSVVVEVPILVGASLLGIAVAALASAAMIDLKSPARRAVAALCLAVSTTCLHLGAVAAVHIVRGPHASPSLAMLGPVGVVVSVAVVLGVVVSMSTLIMWIAARSDQDALARLRELFEALPVALLCFDRDDRVTFWNARCAQTMGALYPLRIGLAYEVLIRASVKAGMYPDAVGDEAGWIARHLAARGATMGARTREANRGGRWVKFHERRSADGGFISVATDITALKRSGQTATAALARAEAADRVKSEFLSNIGHELRTPLNGVLGLSEALGTSGLTAEQTAMVQALHASAHTLTDLIGSILELSDLQAGTEQAVARKFDPVALVRDTADLFRSAVMAKGLALEVEVTGAFGAGAIGDPARPRQVLINLLANAVKFTDAGGVRLSLDLERVGTDRLRLRFEVRDTGIGFDEAQAETLFAQFQQADASLTRKHGGAGVGLAISRQVVRLLGGELVVRSKPGRGAAFSFEIELPVGDDLPAAAPDAALCVEPPSLPMDERSSGEAPLRVLLADDHPTNRQVVELILKSTDSALTSVENGAQAFDAFQRARYDLVLMDLQMPVMDGLTAIKLIREFEQASRLPRTPMIALTANVLAEHVAASLAAGADRHVGKPITAARLLEEIARLFELEQAVNDVSDAA